MAELRAIVTLQFKDNQSHGGLVERHEVRLNPGLGTILNTNHGCIQGLDILVMPCPAWNRLLKILALPEEATWEDVLLQAEFLCGKPPEKKS